MFDIDDNATAFDLAIGLYTWLSHWYGGIGCEKYAAMSKIVGKYNLQHFGGLDEMSQYWYDMIDEDNWQEVFGAFCDYMDNEWDKEAC